MTKRDIIQHIVEDREYFLAVRRICPYKEFVRDVFNDLIIKVNEIEESKLADLFNRKVLLYYFIRMVQYEKLWLNYLPRTDTDNFVNLEDSILLAIEPENNYFDIAASEIARVELEKVQFESKEDWYTTRVTQQYIKHKSLRNLANKLGVPYRSLGTTVTKFRDRILIKEQEYKVFMAKNVLNDLPNDVKQKLYLAAVKAGKSPEKFIEDYLNDLERKLQNDQGKTKTK